MSRKTPGNPNKITPTRVRHCDGIGGGLFEVLRRYDDRGRDISTTMVNEIYDIDLVTYGALPVRNGCRKMNDTGKTGSFQDLFMLNLGRELKYGYIVDGVLNVVDIPDTFSSGQVPFDFEPAEAVTAVATVYPISYPGDPQ